jgi:hypothetical protein
VRNSGKKLKAPTERSAEENEINGLLLDIEQSMGEALQGKNLQGLILTLSPPERRR